MSMRRFVGKVGQLRHGGLHAECQLVVSDGALHGIIVVKPLGHQDIKVPQECALLLRYWCWWLEICDR